MKKRPDVFTYANPASFVKDMLAWRKETSLLFSVRREVVGIRGLSPTHVTLLAQGKRRLTPESAEGVARLLGLSHTERIVLNQLCGNTPEGDLPKTLRSQLNGEFLGQWFHLHIWESARLFDFRPHHDNLFSRLRGLAAAKALQRGFDFLLHHGFLRRLPSGRIVPDAEVLESTDGIPNKSIQKFHSESLRLAAKLTQELQPDQRECQTLLLSLSQAQFEELRTKLKQTSEDLTQWASAAKGEDAVFQVVLSAVPYTTPSKARLVKPIRTPLESAKEKERNEGNKSNK